MKRTLLSLIALASFTLAYGQSEAQANDNSVPREETVDDRTNIHSFNPNMEKAAAPALKDEE
jgi:hypothetical protein